MAILGDYAFGAAALEVETAARVGAPVVFVVANNEGIAGHSIQDGMFPPGAPRIAALLPAHYEKFAELVDGHAERVDRPSQIRPALDRALASGRSRSCTCASTRRRRACRAGCTCAERYATDRSCSRWRRRSSPDRRSAISAMIRVLGALRRAQWRSYRRSTTGRCARSPRRIDVRGQVQAARVVRGEAIDEMQ